MSKKNKSITSLLLIFALMCFIGTSCNNTQKETDIINNTDKVVQATKTEINDQGDIGFQDSKDGEEPSVNGPDIATNDEEQLPVVLESGSIYTAPRSLSIYEKPSIDSKVIQKLEEGWSVSIDTVIDETIGCYSVSLFMDGNIYSGYMFIGKDDIPTYRLSESKSEEKTPTEDNAGDTVHSCEECGKPASHSMKGLNGTLEWYCNDHWKQMQEMLDYMMNN